MNVPDDVLVDHWDHDGLHNVRANLRVANKSANGANRRKSSNNTSGFKGVTTHRQTGKWQAEIKVGGKHRYIGIFDTPEEAAKAYDDVAHEAFGEFALLNFPRNHS